MTEKTTAKTVIIGVGNEMRGDDAAGLHVVRSLRLDDVQLMELPGEGSELMDAWQGCGEVFVIDAARSGADAGSVFRLDATDEALPRGFFSYSTHAFGLAEAVETSRNLGTLPEKLVIYAIEGKQFAHGSELSPEVAGGVAQVITHISDEAQHA